MKDPFQYTFRFCCDPGFNDETELQALAEYVQAARIDDVAVFANVEELNTGHMSFEEQDVFLTLMRRVRDRVAPLGATLSVNQWHSVMHADLGKTLRPEQPFRRMVDPAGHTSQLCVCPLCENWQAYISRLYARYAQLEPEILWVEDDFRLHNHAPLTWGGCFCEAHMALYSARAGRPLTRAEFVKGILQPGPPHPYRKIWLDVSRETMLLAAEAIGRAVRAVTPKTKVGLMSSAPHIHAAEGRDWHALLRALAAGAPPVDRVHLPGYQELAPSAYLRGFNMVSMLTRALLPPETEIYPELENFPFSRFSKSRRFTRFQLLSALPLNLKGITIDLYDLNGNGIVWEEGYQDTLRDTKDYLNALTSSGVFRLPRLGVKVLINPRACYSLETAEGLAMEELYPHEVFFAGLLPAMGVPFAYCPADAPLKGQIAALSGQVLRGLSRPQIEALFRDNFILLNGDAAFTLFQLGLGRLARMESARWLAQDSGACAYEQVTNGKTYCGVPHARASAMISCSDLLEVSYADPVTEFSQFCNSFRARTAPGQVLAGQVLIYPFGRFADPLDIPPMLLNNVRQAILQDALAQARPAFPLVVGEPYLEPYCFADRDRLFVYLVNAGSDPVAAVRLAQAPAAAQAQVFVSNEKAPRTVAAHTGPDGVLTLELALDSMETALITLPRDQGGKAEP